MSDRIPTTFPGVKALRKKFPKGKLIRLALCDEKGGTISFQGSLPVTAEKVVANLVTQLLTGKSPEELSD